MKFKLSLLNNQDGFLIPTTLLLMVTLTIIGLLVTKDSTIESFVGRNYVIHKQTESVAEHAAKDTIAHINQIFIDPAYPTATEVKIKLGGGLLDWTLYDGYNTAFDYELPDDWSSLDSRDSISGENLSYITSAETIAVLVDQSTSTITPGVTGGNVPDYFIYDIYSRAEHAAAGNSEVILLIGYVEIK